MLTLIKNGEVYAPHYLGKKDILITGDKFGLIEDYIQHSGLFLDSKVIEVIDAEGKYIVPGFIDGHVHIIGGGGEGGFNTRTPEIYLSDLTKAGITTVVGCLGTDGITRNMTSLLAKARGLTYEGISVFIMSGSYRVPVVTLTGDLQKDLILVPEVLGVGEIAISDHRSFEPTLSELKKLAAEVRVAGMLSGKKGAINVHLGDSKRMLDDLWNLIGATDIPASHFIVTHGNRNSDLFREGLKFMEAGGFLDLTTSTTAQFLQSGEVKCSLAMKHLHENNISFDKLTLSSDGQGSLPHFNEKGDYLGLKVGGVDSLYREVREAIIEDNVPIEKAISTITKNPSIAYGIKGKGEIALYKDADLVILDKVTLEIETVLAKGKIMIEDKKARVKGTFE